MKYFLKTMCGPVEEIVKKEVIEKLDHVIEFKVGEIINATKYIKLKVLKVGDKKITFKVVH